MFFFIIQTYNTSLLYVILTKRLVLPIYLRDAGSKYSKRVRDLGILVLGAVFALGVTGLVLRGKYTYISLIVSWVMPVLLLQW